MGDSIRLRRNTAAGWAAKNYVLGDGEVGLVKDASPRTMKIGDGATAWNDLPFVTGRGAPAPWMGGLTDEQARALGDHLADQALSARTFGAKGDAQQVFYTASITAAASPAVLTTSLAHALTSADVGKTIVVPGAGASGAPLTTTIAAVGSTTTITLATPASTTLSSVSTMLSWFTDDTVALNKWLARCRASRRTGYLPWGSYGITAPLVVTPPLTVGATAITVFGAGHGYNGEAFQFSRSASTILCPGLVDQPALAISSGKGVNVYDLAIVGGNTKAFYTTGQPGGAMSDDQTAWVSPGFRDTRYSPQCAIHIDPYRSTSTPSDGGYPGATYSGSYTSSSTINIDRVAILHHVVGIANYLAPSLAGNQGDTISMDGLRVYGASACYAAGQAQSRACRITRSTFGSYRTVLDGLTYGDRQGQVPSLAQCNLGFGWMGFRVNPNYSDVDWKGVYNEGCMHIGHACATGGVQYPVSILGGQHSRRGDYSPMAAGPIYLEATCPVTFEGHIQDASSSQIPALSQATQNVVNVMGAPFHFRSGSVGCDDADKLILGSVWFGQDNLRLTDANVIGYGASNVRRYGQVLTPTSGMTGRYQPQQMCFANDVRAPGGVYHYLPASSNGLLSLAGGSPSITNPGGDTMTFTIAAGFLKYLQVGDLVPWQVFGHQGAPGGSRRTYLVPAYKITAIDTGTNTITCTALFTTTGYYDAAYSTLYVIMREWAPMQALTGDLASSTTVSNVSPTTIVKNGDWIRDAIGQIPALTRVVSGGGTATLTLSQAATTTLTGQRLGYGRLYAGAPLSASKYLDPASIAAATPATITTITVAGARAGDQVFPPQFSTGWGGLMVWGEVTANDTVTVYGYNPTGSAIDKAGGLLSVQVQPAPI